MSRRWRRSTRSRRKVARSRGWRFATADLEDATALLKKVEQLRARSQFWKRYFLEETKELRKDANAREELSHFPGVAETIQAFNKIIQRILSMASAR